MIAELHASRCIIERLKLIVRVSFETIRIVKSLPPR